MEYGAPAVSAYQQALRGQAQQLRDHICKKLDAVNLERVRWAHGGEYDSYCKAGRQEL